MPRHAGAATAGLRAALFTIVVVVCLAVSGRAQGNGNEFLRASWTTAGGLPQNTVNAILQTRDGYLWIATNGGLARFDGVAFTLFTVGNTPGLKSNRILALHEDRAGTLWIATELGGIARLRGGASLPPITAADGLPDDRVFTIVELPDGDLWAGTSSGIARLHEGRVAQTYSARNGLPTADNETDALLADPDGGLWIGNNTGLFHLKDGAFTVVSKGTVRSAHIRSLHRGADGTLWVGMYSGLARLHDGALEAVDPSLDLVSGMTSDARGDTWAASSNGLVWIHDGRLTRYGTADGLADTNIHAVAVDREGDVWVGGLTGGLARWRPRPVAFISQRDGLAGRSILPVLADREGRVWAGALCGGLSRLDGGRWATYGRAEGLRDLCVEALAEARDGTIWVGTASGLFKMSGGRFTEMTPLLTTRPGGARVHAIHEDRAGTLWIGSTLGLSTLDGDRLVTRTSRDGLVNDDVRFITETRDGALWIGTTGGASRLVNGRFTSYTTANGLSHGFVRAIYEDPDGTTWLGTYGGGLNRLKDGHIVAITTRQGLFDDAVSAILEDGAGNFWMSGNRGVFRVARRELNDVADGKASSVTSIGYGVADGMDVNETNGGAQPAGIRTPDGRLWFPTIGGLAVFDPARNLNRVAPPVVIEQVIVDGRPLADPSEIEIAAGSHRVDIRYTGLSLSAPERVRFRYTLEGYDPAPVDAGTRRVAYYTNLPPGRYRFRVTAANSDGVWNDAGAVVALRQVPRFYQTWAFDLLALVAAAALAGAGYRARLRQLVRRTRELERRVEARTAEVVERSNELAVANTQLADANRVIAAAHDDMLSTLNQLRLGVALVEKSGRVSFLNRQARQLLDLDPGEAIEQAWYELLPLSAKDRTQLEAAALAPQAHRTRLPVRVETPSRRTYWMEIDVHDDPRDPDRRIFCLYDLSEIYDLRRLLDGQAQFHGLVGQSATMQLVFKQVRDVAGVDATVLIEGETGTGKELVARAVHESSSRRSRPFVAVNCAALSESLLSSHLFGHRRGAFTGAVADQIGLFESADGGTAFLDEIGDVPLPIQTSLLRVLQEKEITRVGEHRPHKIDVRIVAATHRDLAREVAEGRFREDLLYRIRVARIQLPPLRDRKDDIPLLVAWFLGQARAASRRHDLEISQESMDLLIEYSWPGNVRELKSAIDSAAIHTRGSLVQPADLPPEVRADADPLGAVPLTGGARQEILDALARAKGNRAAAARLLGIGRSTLYRRLRAMGLEDDQASAV